MAIFVTFLAFNGSSILTAFVDILLKILLMSKMFTTQRAIIATLVKIFDKDVFKGLDSYLSKSMVVALDLLRQYYVPISDIS